MSFGGQRAILWGICQVANEIGFIEETVKWWEQGSKPENQTRFSRLPHALQLSGEMPQSPDEEQSRRNANSLELEFPGSPGPVFLVNIAAEKGDIVRYLGVRGDHCFLKSIQKQDPCPSPSSSSDWDVAGVHRAVCGPWAQAWPGRFLETG